MKPSNIRNAQKVTIEFLSEYNSWFTMLTGGSVIGATPFYSFMFRDNGFEERDLVFFSSSTVERKLYVTARRCQIHEAIRETILLNPWLVLGNEIIIGYGNGDFEADRVTAELEVKFHDLISSQYVESVNKFLTKQRS